MKNLTDHVCSKCQHLNRFDRTSHGHLTDAYKAIQQKIDNDIQRNYYKMIPYYRKRLDSIMSALKEVESGERSTDYLKHRPVSKIVIYF